MKLSLDAWSIAGFSLVAVGGLLLFFGRNLGVQNALGLWVVIAGVATNWGRDGYSNRGSAEERWHRKVMFWLAIAVLAINILIAKA